MHSYQSFTFFELLAGFGGLYRLLGMYFGYFITKINKKILAAKYIRGMYFLHKPMNLRPKINLFHKNYSMNIMNIKINLWDSCKRISLRKRR